MILDESTLRKLRQLSLISPQVRAGAFKGERRSTRRGTSIEFADYRDYTPGDDLRRLDWNVYARLGRPYIKLHEEEEDLAVHIWLDGSGSMDWGSGEQNKFQYALKIAAALGTIGLNAGDLVTTSVLHAEAENEEFKPSRGRTNLIQYLRFFDQLEPSGVTDLNRSLTEYTYKPRRPGLGILISDLFSPAVYLSGIKRLQSSGYDLVLIHTLTADEVDPPLNGDLRLIDIETGNPQDVSLTGGLRDIYRRRVMAWRSEIRRDCWKHDIRYVDVITDKPWDRVVLLDLRGAKVLK